MKWSKLLTNLQVNATSAILNWGPAEVLRNPISYQIEVMQLQEAVAVMEKMGLKIVNLPGTPVKLLVKAITRLPEDLGRFMVGIPLSKARGSKMPSLHIDLHSGRGKSEVDFLNGAIVKYGNTQGVNTPVNMVLTKVLTQLTDGSIDRATFFSKPEKLWTRIEEIQ
jgi:2-dehydropantoate 2-reductase